MATHTVSNKRKTMWEIDDNGDTWIVNKNASIKAWNFATIYEENSFSNNTIKVFGDLTVLGSGDGIRLEGTATRTVIGKDATIIGLNAIRENGADQHISNSGELIGTGCGIFSSGDNLVFTNNGKIFANMAADINGDDARFVNGTKGVIHGEFGIVVPSSINVEIINMGFISANSAIQVDDVIGPAGSAHVVNRGVIYGQVYLGEGDDIFDTRGGFLEGTVMGGDGDDLYLISDSDTALSESASEGNDSVRSSATYTLFDDFENLLLLGKKNIDGEGNNGGNILKGNSGKNTLLGFDGVDLLNGGKGNDRLDGSDDDVLDLYSFDRGTGKDVIVTFEDGDDLISLANYDGLDAFADIAVTQDGADTLIALLGGDSIRIKNFTATNITGADVAFEIF